MKNSDSGKVTRRRFIGITALLSFLSLAIPTSYFLTRKEKEGEISLASRKLIKGEFKFFTPYQSTVVGEVASLLIPTDDLPGAREAGVVFELDRIIAESNKLKKLYSEGVNWLDYMAAKISEKESFLDLSQDDQIKILKIADSDESRFIYKVYLSIRYWKIRTAIEFFNTIRKQTFETYYTSEVGWEVVGYQGPPQWNGNLDYYKCS